MESVLRNILQIAGNNLCKFNGHILFMMILGMPLDVTTQNHVVKSTRMRIKQLGTQK